MFADYPHCFIAIYFRALTGVSQFGPIHAHYSLIESLCLMVKSSWLNPASQIYFVHILVVKQIQRCQLSSNLVRHLIYLSWLV